MYLVLNSAKQCCYAALLNCDGAYCFSEATSFEELLAEICDWDVSSVKGIGVCTGPGRFASMRSGVAFALGISISLSVPIVGYSSFEGYGVSSQEILLLPLGSKGCGVAYLKGAEGIESDLVKYDDLADLVITSGLIPVSPQVDLISEHLKERVHPRAVFWMELFCLIKTRCEHHTDSSVPVLDYRSLSSIFG